MQVHCRCGQEFTTYDTRFPLRVCCHACGAKFMVLEDGTTDEIRAISIDVQCRCGRPYTINSIQFPRTIHCVSCDRRFSVLDNGETIAIEQEVDDPPPIQSNAISALHVLLSADVISDGIRKPRLQESRNVSETPVPKHPIRADEDITQPGKVGDVDQLALELELLDLQWNHERKGFALFEAFGTVYFPSRGGSVMLFALWLIFWVAVLVYLVDFQDISTSGAALCCGIGALLGIALPIAAFGMANKYDVAESEWIAKRRALLRRHQRIG